MAARAAAADLVSRLLIEHGGTTGRSARRRPAHRPRGRPARRAVALAAAAVVVAAGLVSLPVAPASAEVERLPPEADILLVSRTDQGASGSAYVTPDGQKVAYVSTAGDLVEGTRAGTANIFLATATQGSGDPFSGEPQLVSRPDASLPDAAANDVSDDPVVSADGRHVAFVSHATNLVPGGSTAGRAHVYVRDMLAGTTFRVDAGTEPDADASEPDISDDGRYVVFTSEATNLAGGGAAADVNDAADVFVADLDENGDGTRGDIAITRLHAGRSVPGGTSQPAISGDGDWIVYTASVDDPTAATSAGEGTSVFRTRRGADSVTTLVFAGAHDGTIDAVGEAVAAIVDDCEGGPVIAAATLDAAGAPAVIGVGGALADRRVGELSEPFISADGSTIAWSTTQPEFDADLTRPPGPLSEPVVRVAHPVWRDADPLALQCEAGGDDVRELGAGGAVGLSASGRTVVFGGPSGMTAADESVTAVDLHSHDGLSVSHTMGELALPGSVTGVPIGDIPVSAVTDYGAALANTPLFRLPLAQLPISRLPLADLPISRLLTGDSPASRVGEDETLLARLPILGLAVSRLPVQRADIRGGWAELLAETEFAGGLEQSVTLAGVLTWAHDTLDGGSADPAAREAAERIRSLSLADVGLGGTGIDALSIASVILGDAPLSQVSLSEGESPREAWQSLVDVQGLGVDVDDSMVLAELDAAGLAIDQTGVEAVPVNGLPLEATMLDELPLAPDGGRPGLFLDGTPLGALDVSELRPTAQAALFGGAREGTVAENASSLLPSATVADLALGAPDTVTLGTVLFSVLDRASYPWDQIDPTVIPAGADTEATAGTGCRGDRCGSVAQFRFTFDPGPGEQTTFTAPTATVTLPASSRLASVRAAGSGPDFADDPDEFSDGPVQSDGSVVRFPLPDTPAGTVRVLGLQYTDSRQSGSGSSRADLTSGELSAHDEIVHDAPQVAADAPAHNRTADGQWQAAPKTLTAGTVSYEWISPAWTEADEQGRVIQSPADDEDWYEVAPPGPGERLVISSNAADGQIALSLLKPAQTQSPLGIAVDGDAPGIAVTEQEGRDAGSPAESGADAGSAAPGLVLVDQAVVGGDGTATVQAASASADGDGNWLVRVTSGNGLASRQPYSLQATYVAEVSEQRCAPWIPPVGVEVEDPFEPWPAIESDPVTAETNTVYLIDTGRFRSVHGLETTDDLIASIRALDGVGRVGDGSVSGAILSIDTDPAVLAARFALDAQPCSISARRDLTAAINAFATAAIGSHREDIASVVIIGGDDMIPFAPVAQNTGRFTEAGHAGQLALSEQPDGSACPAAVAPEDIDPCATPLSAAAAANYILTDDPYGLAVAYRSLGGYLYVPTVAVGRLVDTPDQIRGQLDRFRLSEGLLEGDSALSGGYGAWAELPQLVSENLAWRLGGGDTPLTEPWTKQDAESLLFPVDGTAAPRIVSLNTHADERRLLAGADDAEGGAAEILEAADHAPPLVPAADDVFDPDASTSPLDGAVVFMLGGHAGNNLPASYYGDATDWADVFGPAGGFVGNTGFGLADDVTTALSERLLALYADWIGVGSDAGPVSSGAALMFAKQSYLGGLGLSTGYDEKVLLQSVYYGVPMYAFADSTKAPPLPPAPDLALEAAGDGLSSASLTLTPSFAAVTRTDRTGADVTFVSADGELPVAVAGQPLLPRVVTRIPAADDAGNAPRGALITGLVSKWSGTVRPAIGDPGVGVEQSGVTQDGLAFPSQFASISRQATPDGDVALVVTTPASVQSATRGLGRIETFRTMELELLYGPAGDSSPPVIRSTEQRAGTFTVSADDSTDDGAPGVVSRALLLVQPVGDDAGSETEWQAVELVTDADGAWGASLPPEVTGPYRWILQVVDGAGNVTTDSARGRIQVSGAPAPELGDPGEDAAATVGERVVRGIPVTAFEGSPVTGSYRLLDAGGSERGAGTLTISPSADGSLRAVFDTVATAPGAFTVELQVCAGAGACAATASFGLEVEPRNSAPGATVSLGDGDVTPSSTLTAQADGTDPDGDDVLLTYRWLRNGVPIEGADDATLALAGVAQRGDVVRVEVTPHDGGTAGHAASADVVVAAEKPRPTIAVWATSAGETYAEGTWARADVVVSFTCTGSGVDCPSPQTVSTDTAGRLVERTIIDEYGRTASASITVALDKTAPALDAALTPDPVVAGVTATATAGATDGMSGVAHQSCDVPDTATAGLRTLTCRATDVAGNTATATVLYSVALRPRAE